MIPNMHSQIHSKIRSSLLALSTILLIAPGCASTQLELPGVGTARSSSAGIHIQSVRLTRTRAGLLVSGTVGRAPGFDNSHRRHLDVEVVGENGVVTSRVPTGFTPNPIRVSRHTLPRSAYAVMLSQPPTHGSTVRVVVHAIPIPECPY